MIEPSGTGTRSAVPSSLPFMRLEHEARGPGRAGRGRDDVDGGGAGPAQVAVGAVDQLLVARVGVHGRHQALLHAEGVVEHLDHRHEAVRGARGVGHDLVRGRVEGVVVDADHERGVGAGRGADTITRRAPLEVGGRLVPVGEDAGGLDDDVDAEIAPRELLRVALGEDLDGVAVDVDAARPTALTSLGSCPMDGVVLQEVGDGVDRAEVVDGDDVDVGALLAWRPGRSCARCARSR